MQKKKDFYWCPHNMDLEPEKVVQIALISRKSSWVPHPLHMHGHSYAVVAMEYNVSESMGVDYFLQLQKEGKVKLNLDNPIRKDTVVVPCKYPPHML